MTRWISWATAVLTLLTATPASAQSLQDSLARLSANSRAAHSDTLLVMQDDRVLLEERGPTVGPAERIEMMSATKGVVALVVLRAVDQGLIESLDTPIHRWFPEWRQGRKADVTLRMLLTHTSGLQNVPNTSVEIYPSPDFVQLALAAELETTPGARYSYNNKATNLLAGIVERATGRKLDDYAGAELFAPLGIVDYGWTRDQAGNPHGMAGLQLSADNAARLGRLVLDRGVWQGRRLIRTDLMDALVAPGSEANPEAALLWFRTPSYRRYTLEASGLARLADIGLRPDIRKRVAKLQGRRFETRADMREALIAAIGTDGLDVWADTMNRAGETPAAIFTVEAGPIAAWHAEGYLGQYIVVVPEQRLVAVRQYRARPDAPSSDSFPSLIDDLIAVAAALR